MTSLLPRAPIRDDGRHREAGSRAGDLTLDNWQDAPHNRWAFAHVAELVPTAPIAHRPAVESAREVVGLEAMRSSMPDLPTRLEESYTDALVVVRDGELVAEHYREGFGPDGLHLLMSVSKSLCGLTIGTLVDEGVIDPDRRVDHYVPALAGSAYGDAKVQQVLDMTVDVDYDEDYRNPASEVQAQDRVAGWRTRLPGDPADTYAFLAALRGGGEHGVRFRYCSAGTDVLAWIVESVTGTRYADAVSERLWSRLGCRNDARITIDPGGFGFANGGISCTARDLSRVGVLMLGDGVIDGRRVVSAEWVRRTIEGGDPDAAAGSVFQRVHPGGAYSNQWWITGSDRGDFYAVGIHGQFIWVDPATRSVVVKFSSWPEPVTEGWNRLHAELFRDICDAVG
ncbi:serine hydrolase domain-containing protein [Agromyces marinus]|uniref:6-aminohexanoate-dimer hydrolase n=1 Tax=Agromyces marinus TaxID=1389020 RepID=A0ABM8H0R8_9MICO|nr:serine hydrolase [Agromyces marinus]UIP57532.1 6-aminohexanoate-dimer hydrolase [Agromyces marinus]BDZ54328.1 6-aminohexanoate-dimer hydrolase [Agromyces marinus]